MGTPFILASWCMLLASAGDRLPDVTIAWPPAVFHHTGAGGRVLDLTKPPFNAKGDGRSDDTAAFIAAYDDVLHRMDPDGWSAGGPNSRESWTIYLPEGTYLVSDTIIYSGPLRYREGDGPVKLAADGQQPRFTAEALVRMRFIGESRERTVIRLKDHAAGFGPGQRKPVLSFGKGDGNNCVASNSVRHLTIDTGQGNPGAVGIDFAGANNTGLHDLTIRSGDGTGACGLLIRISPTMGYHSDLTIEGFDTGIAMEPYHVTHNTFEHVTIRGQRQVGVRVVDSTTSLRDVLSSNSVAAFELTGQGGQAVILDSVFDGGDPHQPAVRHTNGELYLRQVTTRGYGDALAGKLPGGTVTEYLSGQPVGATGGSLRLPIEEVPEIPEPAAGRWAVVDDFGAIGDGITDDTAAIQRALDAGKPAVCFPKLAYRVTGTLRLPPTVTRLNLLFGVLDKSGEGAAMEIGEGAQPLVIEDGYLTGQAIAHTGPRTLVLQHLQTTGVLYRNLNATARPKLFLNACNGWGKRRDSGRNVDVWARFINTEQKSGPNFYCEQGSLWVLGYKVEGGASNFVCYPGGKVEVLGGVGNQFGQNGESKTPMVVNAGGTISYIGCTNGPSSDGQGYLTIIQDGDTTVPWTDLPRRVGRKHQVFVPLYRSGP